MPPEWKEVLFLSTDYLQCTEEETVPSVCEASAPGRACTALCVFQMCPQRSMLFSSNLSWSLQEETLGCQGSADCRLRTRVLEVSRAQMIRQDAYIVSLCIMHLFSFPACFAYSGFFSWICAVLLLFICYSNSKSCDSRSFLLKSALPSVQIYTSGAAVRVSCGCRIAG